MTRQTSEVSHMTRQMSRASHMARQKFSVAHRPRQIYTRLLLVIFCVPLVSACGLFGAQPTPDVEALVDARLTQVALESAATETPSPDGTPDATPAADTLPETANCRVLATALNLRSGPDEIFAPITALPQNSELIPQRINPAQTFLFVQVVGGEQGWVSTRADLIDCPQGLADLPVDTGPPTPTPTPTSETPPTPTPTPTQAVAVIIPRAGGGDGDLTGDVVTQPDLFVGPVEHPVFRTALLFQILVSYGETAGQDYADGGGIDFVDVFITNDDTGDLVYETRLDAPPYCAFGGATPCAQIPLQAGARWPGSSEPIVTGDYSITFSVTPLAPDAEGGAWRIAFSIWLSGDAPPPFAQLQADFVQVWRGSDELVFRVETWDPLVGAQDGAGIANVLHRIVGPAGQPVYEKIENDPAYCAFGGDAPCPAYSLAQAGYRWPNGGQVQSGTHQLIAIVRAEDGRTRTFTEEIDIVTAAAPTTPIATLTPTHTPTPPPSGDLYAEPVQLGDANGLIFQIAAWDPAVGQRDGDGIQQVDMSLIGPSGETIHARIEEGAPYCLFSNPPNSTTCNVWRFSQNNFQWPNGDTIQTGEYTLRAVVYAASGAARTVEVRALMERN